MNPHTHDFRDTVRPGEKTGDPFQSFKARHQRPSAWLVFSTIVTVAAFLILVAAVPWGSPW